MTPNPEIAKSKTKPICGIIMPISDTENYPPSHWGDVLSIINEAIASVGGTDFECRLVSENKQSHLIHKTIIQNVFTDEIAICDVSSQNPNVLFELGMRLAFDRPVVVIKDDVTPYAFDTGIIEHIPYPKGLRHNQVLKFKVALAEKVEQTYLHSQTNPRDSFFLSNFNIEEVASLSTKEISQTDAVLNHLEDLNNRMGRIENSLIRQGRVIQQRRGLLANSSDPDGQYENYLARAHNQSTEPLQLNIDTDAILKGLDLTSDVQNVLSPIFPNKDSDDKF